MSVLEISSLTIRINEKELISNFSALLEKPAFIAILGHNGKGKSTFLKALNNQIPYQGKILLHKQDLQNFPSKKLSRTISFLQQKNPVFFDISAQELVVMGRYSHKKFLENYSAEDYDLAFQAMDQLGIGKLADKNFSDLSGGEQQLIWIAQLLLQDTEVWMLDEPTQQLDLYNKKKVFSLLMNLARVQQKTILCVTHDINYLEDFAGQYYINFSAPNPALKQITQQSLQEEIRVLESEI